MLVKPLHADADHPPPPSVVRRIAISGGWLAVWVSLVATLVDARAAALLVACCVANLVLFVVLERGALRAFAVQVRIAFLLWIVAALATPALHALLYIPAVGVAARLLTGYCLLARMVSLLPWNRRLPLSRRLLVRTFLSGPTTGAFVASPPPRGQTTATSSRAAGDP
jgi:hypothetical protein